MRYLFFLLISLLTLTVIACGVQPANEEISAEIPTPSPPTPTATTPPNPTATPSATTTPFTSSLPILGKAPDIRNKTWLNSEPMTLSSLKGKVVLVEFWTYT